MSKSVPLTDFRAVRRVLEPHEFALGGEGDDVPPTDLIDVKTWHGIMHLPDDVAIRISDHNGTRLQLLYSLWSDWLEAIGDDPDNPDELFNCMPDAADCFQCATFDFLHGFYRAAIANLRSALELVMIGTYGNVNPTFKEFLDWKNGASELGYTRCRKLLHGLMKDRPAGWLLGNDQFPAATFRDLCRFTHSRPDASDGALWESNGPVYNNDAIVLAFYMSLRVYAICYLLVKIARPKFELPKDSHILFELDWLPNHGESLRAFKELYGAG